MTEYNDSKLNELGIHDLRDLGRKIGVRSPTSLRREVLIERIMEIVRGEKKPYVSPTKQGRPPKLTGPVQNVVDYILPATAGNEKDVQYNLSHPSLSFAACAPKTEYKTSDDAPTLYGEGIVEIYNNGYGVLRLNSFEAEDNDPMINASTIKKFYLKSGDFITGSYRAAADGYPGVLVHVETVNGSSQINKLENREDFNDLLYRPLNKTFQGLVQGKTIYKGSRNYLLFKKKINKEILEQVAASFTDAQVYIIHINALPEERYVNTGNINFVPILFNRRYGTVLEVVHLVCERAKRITENGKDVVVILNSLTALNKALVQIYGNVSDAVYKIKDYSMLAKNVDTGSLTMIAADEMKNSVQFDEFDMVVNSRIEIDA